MLAVVASFVHSWSVRGFLHELPSFINYLRIGQILAVFAYMMATALVESLLVTAILVLAGALAPRRWFLEDFPTNSLLSVLVAAVAMIKLEDALLVDTRQLPPYAFYYAWLAATLAVWITAMVLARRWKAVRSTAAFLVERLSLLGYLYLFLGVAGVLVVIIRNLW